MLLADSSVVSVAEQRRHLVAILIPRVIRKGCPWRACSPFTVTLVLNGGGLGASHLPRGVESATQAGGRTFEPSSAVKH